MENAAAFVEVFVDTLAGFAGFAGFELAVFEGALLCANLEDDCCADEVFEDGW